MIDEKSIQLYFVVDPVLNPKITNVFLNIYGIKNIENTLKHLKKIMDDFKNKEFDKNYFYLGTINCFKYDSEIKSKPNDLYLIFDINNYNSIVVNCKALEIIEDRNELV